MGMVDSQSCSSSNQTRLDGTSNEKEGEVRSFGDQQSVQFSLPDRWKTCSVER